MSLPKRARKITVDHREYRWLLSDARRPFQWLVTVQAASGSGQRLRTGVPCAAAGVGPAVSPALVARVIREALSRGWSPEEAGEDVRLQMADPVGEPPPEPHRLSGPLWNLMLWTNGCSPGCGCGEDQFHITPENVREWVRNAGPESAQTAAEQLRTLLSSPTFAHDLRNLCYQVNEFFPGGYDGNWEWLHKWHTILAPMCGEPAPPDALAPSER